MHLLRSGTASARAAFSLVAGAALSSLLVGCTPARAPAVPTVRVALSGTPTDARVTIDDVGRGALQTLTATGVDLAAGDHRISVEADGYFPYDVVVHVARVPLQIPITLRKLPE